jgi:hypothetical protein
MKPGWSENHNTCLAGGPIVGDLVINPVIDGNFPSSMASLYHRHWNEPGWSENNNTCLAGGPIVGDLAVNSFLGGNFSLLSVPI